MPSAVEKAQGNDASSRSESGAVAKLAGREVDVTLILDGLMQSWPLHGDAAVASAKRLAGSLVPAG